ncbi:MAG: hypothetical protein R3C60_10460 [Parvularculaceae bacterium]
MRTMLFATAAAVVLLAAGAAAAKPSLENEGLPPMDPTLALAQATAPRNEFFLNSQTDVELIRFTRAHDNTICVPRARSDWADGRTQSVGVIATFDNVKATINPGNCMSFDAKSVRVKPAGPIPQDEDLVGTIRTTK